MSERGSSEADGEEVGSPSPGSGHQEQELASKMVQIQSKRFYLDVKKNTRGKFIKIAEINSDGRRNQIFFAMSTAAEFRDMLATFADFNAGLGPSTQNSNDGGKLKSDRILKDNRRYFVDLKENPRGRFLRVSQTVTRGGPRSQIAIPVQGLFEFRNALSELLDEFGSDDEELSTKLPEARLIKVENKSFYFDIGQNNRGVFMRVSEVKSNFRSSITIPEKSWTRFRDVFDDYALKMKELGKDDKLNGPN